MFIASRLLLALTLTTSCAFQTAIGQQGFVILGTLGDLRVGWKSSRAGNVEVEASKEQASEHFMEMVEEVLPEIVEGAVRAALLCAGVGAVGSAAGALTSCAIPEAATPTPEAP